MARKPRVPKPHTPMSRGFYNRYHPHYSEQIAIDLMALVDNGSVQTVVDIARHFGTTTDVVYDWVKAYGDFAFAMKYAKEAFGNRLTKALENGAGAGSIFLLKANHGYIEADKKWQLEMHERELNAKMTGNLAEKTAPEVNITFTEVT